MALQFSPIPNNTNNTTSTSTNTSTPQYAMYAAPTPLNAAYGATKGSLTGYGTSTMSSPMTPASSFSPSSTGSSGNTATSGSQTPQQQLASYYAAHPQTAAQAAEAARMAGINSSVNSGVQPATTYSSGLPSSGGYGPSNTPSLTSYGGQQMIFNPATNQYTNPSYADNSQLNSAGVSGGANSSNTGSSPTTGYGPSNTPSNVTAGSSSPYNAYGSAQNTLQSYLDQFNNYTNQQNQTQAQLDAITAKNATLSANAGLGVANVQSQPIADHFVTGQSQGILNNAQAQIAANNSTAIPIQTQLARIQAQKQAAMDAGKLALTAQTPTFQSYNTQATNPLTGQPINGGSVNDSIQAIIDKVKNGSMTYDQATSALGNYGQMGINALTQGLGSNFNVTQSNNNGAINAQQQTQIAGYQSALQQGSNLQSQLKDLITTFGLNPNDINAVNSGLQRIAANTSSPQYKTLQNYVNDIANTYAQILTPSGGSQTDTTRGIAASMLDATASGQSIIQVMNNLDAAAKAKIAGVSTTGNSNSSGGSSNSGSSSWPGWNPQ
jgi:hypothetical protein